MIGDSPDGAVAGRDEPGAQSLDGVFGALADQRRRIVIMCLAAYPDGIAVADLAMEVAIRETGRSMIELPTETVQTIQHSLYHTHLPKLVDVGAVEYETDRTIVRPAETSAVFEHMHSIVEACRINDDGTTSP